MLYAESLDTKQIARAKSFLYDSPLSHNTSVRYRQVDGRTDRRQLASKISHDFTANL